MAFNFITNSNTKELKKRLNQLIENSKELKFLVGFFYFSGIKELYQSLKTNNECLFMVLVGLNVDDHLGQIIEFAHSSSLSNEQIKNNFNESIRKSLTTEYFDKKEFYEQIKFFVELIKKDRLIIRKTIKANHSKLYIFKLDENQVKPKLFITGSSNFTKAGISTQNEFNVEISDYGSDEAEQYFDELWNFNSVEITENKDEKEKLLKIIEQQTLVKEITPFEAYCLVLKTYLDSFKEKEITLSLKDILKKNNYKIYNYQLDAIKQGLAKIESNNGLILADVVGLGKTVIACAIGYELKKRGIVICPPGLIGDNTKESGWRKYLEEFKLHNWEVFSCGDLEKALNALKNMKDVEVVIVDEAHRFRNEDTEGYELLKNICRGKKVILLTATPFNNKPADILSLLKLFIAPKKSTITLQEDLTIRFSSFATTYNKLSSIRKNHNSIYTEKRKKAEADYKSLFEQDTIDLEKVAKKAKYLAKQIRDIIEPVTIRRNRLDLQTDKRYKEEVEELSKVANPEEWYFELSREQSQFYDKVINEYFFDPDLGGKFNGAIYRPFEYERKIKRELTQEENREFQRQRNLCEFMRIMVVKRFESSFGAFKQTIKNFQSITNICKSFIQRTGKFILDRSLMEKIYNLDADAIQESLKDYEKKLTKGQYPKHHKIYDVSKFQNKDQFLNDIESDLSLYQEILNKLEEYKLLEEDPKCGDILTHLKVALKHEPNRKIVIFSEYVDTVEYLEPKFNLVFKDRVLVVKGELASTKIKDIYKNFDASTREEDQENKYDILLTSDKLSEGFNLNRAGMVINYDIPWNPVRVIQRLGRINRISKKIFNELKIVNFFPTEKGADLVRSREIAQNKMFMIHSALGEDSKIFDIDEEPSPSQLYSKLIRNPEEEEQSFYTLARNAFEECKKKLPNIEEIIKEMPPRIKVAKKSDENKLYLFFKKERLYISCAETDKKQIKRFEPTIEEAIEKIKCDTDEKGLQWNTDRFWEIYEKLQKEKEADSAKEQSLEQKALNMIRSLIMSNSENISPYLTFLKTLEEDILYWGTLPDYTLRRISEFKSDKPDEIKKLLLELGENYLEKEKKLHNEVKKELIIAVENKKE